VKQIFKFSYILLLYIGLTTSLFAQPANDTCGTAIPIAVGTGVCNSILYTNVAATTSGNPATPACWLPNSMSHTVWFSFVATTADIELSTNFGGTLANTQIAVYSGGCGGLTLLACQEDINTGGGLFHTNVILHGLTITNTYYIAVDGNGNTTGTFGICAQETLPVGPTLPVQDCVTSQNLCNLNNIVVPNGAGGVGTSQESPSCFGAPGERSSNWFSFTVATSGNLCFAVTPNAVIDYDFAVYNTSASCPGTEISCNWDPTTGALGTTGLGCAGIQCNTCLAVVAGQTYSILIDRYTASSASGFTMSFAGTTATFASPNPTFTATTVCVGTATQFTNTTNGNFTYSWNFGDGNTSSSANPSHTYATNGTYNVTLLLTAIPGGCQNAITQPVTVGTLPTVDAGTAIPICAGGCVTLGGTTNATGASNTPSFTNGSTYAIPDDDLVGVSSPITVSGVAPATIAASSIASVCVNIAHTWDSDLELYLQCPSGALIALSLNNGGSGNNYTNTCFTPTAVTPITSGAPPFTGIFIPEDSFNLLNGCNANGTWQLIAVDDAFIISGTITGWTITFNNNLPAYTWSPTTAMTNSTTLTPTVCPASTTTYTLTANNGVGCTTSDTVTVTVGATIASPILTPTQPTCTATTGTITITAVAGITFSFDGGAYSGTLVYSGLAPGSSHTVIAQNAGGCLSAATNITLNALPTNPAPPILTPTQPTCTVATGIVTITAVAGITFSFDGGAYSGTLVYSGLAAGSSHTVFAQNAAGCISAVSNITLNAQPATPASPIVTPTQPTCAVATGTVTITAVAGVSFSFDGGAYSGTLVYSGLAAGSSHTVFAQNAAGCISAVSNITLNAQPATPAVPILTPTQPTCAVATGTVTITAVAGITFSFDGGAYSGTLVYGGLAAGSSHTVFAQNAVSCISAVSNITLNVQPPTPASPIVTPTQPTCAVATGTVTITAVAGITFSFDGGAYSGTLVYGGLAAGSSHTVFAQNAAGCISTVSNITLNAQPSTPASPILTPTQPTCAVATGTVTITAVAGNTFSFDGGAYSGTLVYGGLAAGSSHTVFAQNAAGCTSTVSNITLNAQPPTPASPILTPTQPTCAVATGTVTITAVAGVTFSFDGGAYSGTLVYGGLAAGSSHTVFAQNAAGCISTVSNITLNSQPATPASPTLTPTQPTCAVATGTVTITAVAGINFSFDGGAYSGTLVYGGLAAGSSHNVFAQNAAGCISAVSNITLNNQPATPIAPILTPTEATCAVATGTITITAVAGVTFSFDGGTYSGTLVYGGLAAGSSHTVLAQNATGCISPISNITLNTQSATPASPILTPTQPTCTLATGTVTITAVAGVTFSFDGGAYSGTLIYGGLAAGSSHTVLAQNAAGCISVVSNITLNAQPSTPASPILTPTQPTCTVSTGTVTITAVAGVSFSFDGGAYSGTLVYGGLAAGSSHTVFAQNAAGCISAVSNITLNVQPPTPASPILTPTQPTCSVATGTVTITAVAGVTFSFDGSAYSGTLVYGGLAAGSSHTVLAQNAAGCISAVSNITLNAQPPTPASPILTSTQPTCVVATGTVTITAVAGVTFSFDGSAYSGTLVYGGLAAGSSHTVFAQNAAGCISAVSNIILNVQPPTPASPILTPTEATCSVATGTVTITAVAGITFSFDGGAYSGTLIYGGLAAGSSHTVFAQNAAGCISAVSNITLNAQPATPASPILTPTQPTCAVATGTVTITAVAGITFSFDGGAYSGTLVYGGLAAGSSHTVFAQNAAGCISAVANITLNNQPTTPASPILTPTQPTCVVATGTVTITAVAGVTFSFDGGAYSGTLVYGGLATGSTHTVFAQNAAGCISVVSNITLNAQPPTPASPIVAPTQPTCSVATGTVTITAVAGNTFSFDGGAYSGTLVYSGLAAGSSHTVFAQNAVGCISAVSNITLNAQPLTPAAPNVTSPISYCQNAVATPLNASGSNLLWYANASGGTGNPINTTPDTSILGIEHYYVSQTANGCESIRAHISVAVNPNITPTFTQVNPICAGDALSPLPTTSINGITGTWSPPLNNTNTTNYIFTPTTGICATTASMTITVYSLPIATTLAPLNYCDPNNDGFGVFDLTQVISTIPNGNTYTVSFHETITDATIDGTSIPNPLNYDNIDVDNQTIYVRVESNTASFCYIILTLDLIVNKTPEATEPADYHVCDDNYDGFANFDLTTITPLVLGTINSTTHTVTYYASSTNAQLNTNPINNLTNYTNQIIATETIWIRIQNNATGCYDIVTVQLFVDPLPQATQPNYPSYSLCDNTAPIGFEVFDLGSHINAISLGQTGMNVTFYLNQADANADINALPLLYQNVAIYVQTIWIRVENANTGCYVLSTMDLRVEPLPTPIPPIAPYVVCDTNQDGFSTFNLNTLTADILQGGNYIITYHETSIDAQLGNNPLSSPYDNIYAFVQFIYVAAIDPLTGCRTVMPIELNVEPSPIMPITLPNLTRCDQDNNNQDFMTLFDLTQQTPIILAAQTSPASNYTVTYYTSLANAQLGTAPIINTSTFIGNDNQTIWVRIEHNTTHCFEIGTFQLEVNTPLALITPLPLSVCDSDTNPNNLFTTFDLTIRNNTITQGLLGYTVTYYPSYPVTSTSIAIANPTNYINTIPAVQTLGVMVTSPEGCISYTTLDIRVLPVPNPNTANIPALTPQCDVNNTGDMLEVFNLTVNAAYIINSDPMLTLHYYPTYNDAVDDTNEILNPTAALVGQNAWIRVENNRVDYLGNNCYVLVEQPLQVNPLPMVIQPIATVQNCDDDTDGFTTFDLTSTTATLLGNNQVATDFTITYYTSTSDAQAGINAIANPNLYTNVSSPETIFVRVVNNATGCVNYGGQFDIIVNPKPTVVAPSAFTTCDDIAANDGFYTLDLNSYIPGIIGSQTNVVTTFYDLQLDAENGTNAITDLTNYQAYTHILWIRVEDVTTGCYRLTSLSIIVEELAEPFITSSSDTICVEWGTNALLSGLTLNSGVTNPNYTFEWSLNGAVIPLATASTYGITTVSPGDYTVVATSTNPPMLGCPSDISNTYTVIQSGPPVADNPAYTVSNAFAENQIIAINVLGFGVYEYSLDDGPFQTSNIFEYATLGTHTVRIKDTRGTISCGEISIQDIQTISYPHYFTPNGDGIHETWNVVGLNQSNAKIYIFDRYGKLLKQISAIGEGWNGTYNGYLLPSTDYWFTVEYFEGNATKIFKSHFSLKR